MFGRKVGSKNKIQLIQIKEKNLFSLISPACSSRLPFHLSSSPDDDKQSQNPSSYDKQRNHFKLFRCKKIKDMSWYERRVRKFARCHSKDRNRFSSDDCRSITHTARSYQRSRCISHAFKQKLLQREWKWCLMPCRQCVCVCVCVCV